MEDMRREKAKLFCYWCGHKDTYLFGKYDQPKCKQCGNYVPKKNRC